MIIAGKRFGVLVLGLLLTMAGRAWSQESNGINPEALIERIVMVEAENRQSISDIVFETELIEGEQSDEGYKEKKRINKRTYLKFLPDTVLFYEEYLEFFKEGVLQSASDLAEEARDRLEKKRKRKGRDISYPLLTPFHADHRALYTIVYQGVAEESVAGYTCHQFEVKANEKSDTLINGLFLFDADSFRLVQASFSPAKLPSKLGFSMKKLDMVVVFVQP